jgi:hypothetical protein
MRCTKWCTKRDPSTCNSVHQRAPACISPLRQIEERAPDFALLDVNLGAETSFEIGEALAKRGIRFAFATGYGEQVAFPAPFDDVPRLRKPYCRRFRHGR